jgi:hypothetical protein
MSLHIDPEVLKFVSESEEFRQLLDEVNKANPRFREIPKDQQRIALALLMTGQLDSVTELERLYVRRPIPSIQEFLTVPYVGETANSIYPKWREDLHEIFAPDSIIRQWGLTGSIGSGKTTIAIVAQLFNLFRVNCLRRPQLSMGSDPTKAMNLQLFTVTLDKVESLLVGRVKTFLQACQYYVEVGDEADFLDFRDPKYEHMIPWCERDDEILFPNRVRIRWGSQSRHALGEDVFGGILDEAEFRIGQDVAEALELYYELLERIRSRFLGSRFTLMCLLSSIKTAKGVMGTYIEEASRRPDTKISQYAIWETKYPHAIEDGYFYVLRGTQRHPSRVMSDEEQDLIDKGELEPPGASEFIKVPDIYRVDFEERTEQSLMNLAGQASLGQEVPFDDLSGLEDPDLCPVLEISAPLQGTKPLRDQLPREHFIQTSQGWRLRRYPGAPRYAHLDLADTGEGGVTILHKELGMDGRVLYVVDFCLKVTSPNRVSLDSVRDLMFDFRDYFGVSFNLVSADQYQSAQMLQKFIATNYAVIKSYRLSVDRNRIPYDTLSTIIADQGVRIGKMRDLKRQLEDVYYDKNKPKSKKRKDIADSLCGAVFNAVSTPQDVPANSYQHFNKIQRSITRISEEYEEVA